MISLEKWKFLKPSQKLYKNVGYLGKNCCHRLWKVAQIAINRPIWSHCLWDQNMWKYIPVKLYLKYQLSFFKRLATEVSWNVFFGKIFWNNLEQKNDTWNLIRTFATKIFVGSKISIFHFYPPLVLEPLVMSFYSNV